LAAVHPEQRQALELAFFAGLSRSEIASRLGDLAVRLAGTIPASAPPAGLRQRVLAEAVPPRAVLALVRGETLNWQPTPFAGVSVARLYEDPIRGDLT
jgi:hypothetical protein